MFILYAIHRSNAYIIGDKVSYIGSVFRREPK